MEILHVSAECYPVAKAGGLGDVVGALPKYQNKAGNIAKVVMPMHRTPFLYNNEFVVDYKGTIQFGPSRLNFTIIKEKTNKLGFDLYLVDINGLTDRTKVYGYSDDSDRFIAFQTAVATWLNSWEHNPDIVHCHDHHTGLLPFMMKYCYAFQKKLQSIKTIFTIHNGEYQGWMDFGKSILIPHWDDWKRGQLEWAGKINPMASAIKCCNSVTTVSNSYLGELKHSCNGLEPLFEYEKGKCFGILNGIDNEVWDPSTDPRINHHFSAADMEGKALNKKELCSQFGLAENLPLIIFIGRLVGEKAADILPDAILTTLYNQFGKQNFLILGSGDPTVEWRLTEINNQFKGYYHCELGYNENLAHKMYAGADFLLMPSRVEPCGLNQMYAMRYGTVPMVRSTGGLQDTVTDMGEWEGFGIRFNNATVSDIHYSIGRAVSVYNDKTHLNWMRQKMMTIDHSWETTVDDYQRIYER